MTESDMTSNRNLNSGGGNRMSGLQNRLQVLRRRHTHHPASNVENGGEGRNEDILSTPLIILLDLLRKRLWLIFLLSIVIGVVVHQWAKTLPKKYKATATIEVAIRSPRVFTNIRDVISFRYQIRRFYATQKVILSSSEIAQKALNSVSWVLQSPGFYGLDGIRDKTKQRELMKTLRPRAHAILQGRTSISAVRRSSLFKITVVDKDPKRAAQLARALAEAYREHNRQFRLRAVNNAFEQVKTNREKFLKSYQSIEKKLVSFRQKNNLLTTSLSDRRSLAFKRLDEVNNRMMKVMLRRIELSSMLQPFLRRKSVDASFPPLLKHGTYWSLKEDYSKLLLLKEKQLARYKSRHPSIVRIERQIKRSRKILDKQKNIVFRSHFQQLQSARREERQLRKKVYIARRDLQRLERLNLYFTSMKEKKTEVQRSLKFLNKRFFEVQLLKGSTTTNVRLIEQPKPPRNPFSPRILRSTAIGGFLGFLVAFIFFFLIELFDRSIRSVEDVEIKAGLTPLGEVPLFDTKGKTERDLLYNPERPLTQIEEAIRAVRTNVLFMTSDVPMRKILFTSPNPREGKTYIATNMAIGIAHTGKKVILIDTDMRRPRVHKALSLDYDRSKGASSVMIGQHTLDEAMLDSGYPNLKVLPCGPIPPSPTELLQTEGFFDMLSELEQRFDVVLFDSPPINHVTDAAVLADYVDGVIFISSAGSTKWGALQGAARRIESVGGRVLGCILNKFSHKHRRSYYYGAYGGYYTSYRYQHYGLTEEEAAQE